MCLAPHVQLRKELSGWAEAITIAMAAASHLGDGGDPEEEEAVP